MPPTWSQKLQCDTTACPRFESVLDNFAVLDKETGLVWEQSPGTTAEQWVDAAVLCQLKSVGARTGWRLPTAEELASLSDPTVAPPGPTLPSGHPFNNVQSASYWSASTLVGAPTWALFVFFGNGLMSYDDKTVGHYIWCVRGGHGYDGK
jgi:hypothetical protein